MDKKRFCWLSWQARRFPSCLEEGRRVKGYEGLDCSSPDVIKCPSSDFASSEEEMVECLNMIAELMDKRNYVEVTREKNEGVRLEENGRFKKIIKRERNEVEVFSSQGRYTRKW